MNVIVILSALCAGLGALTVLLIRRTAHLKRDKKILGAKLTDSRKRLEQTVNLANEQQEVQAQARDEKAALEGTDDEDLEDRADSLFS